MILTADKSELILYRDMAEAGDILIGQELWMELDRLAEDIRQERYLYNTQDARIRMDFMENCVRLTKSPFYNQPMVLLQWEKAFIEALYSFKMPDGLDRFQRALLLISRKNGKSELCGAIGNSEFIVGPQGADIVASSNDDAQASIVYDAIDTMRLLYDPKSQDTHRNQRFIQNRITNSKVFKLSDRTQNKEGRNIDFAILDESHEMKDDTIAKSIEQSQSVKDNPKFIEITTEGFVEDGHLDKQLNYARKVIAGEKDDDPAAERFLPWLYTQDSELEVWNGTRENRLWMKSNPSLGVIKKVDYLEQQIAKAKESKADRIFVLSKDFNIKQNAATAWLNLEDYSYDCAWNPDEFRGCLALGAVDLAETTDLCAAKVMLMKKDEPRKYVLSHYFIPENKLTEKPDIKAGARYKDWAEAGFLTICEGNDIDLATVADWFYQLYADHGIRLWRCGYDQKFANDWIKRMDFYGWSKTGREDSDLINIQQNAQTLNNAIRLAEADFRHQLVWYGDNPVDRWCFSNAGMQIDQRGQALLVKMETEKRIDGAVALAILYEVYRRNRTDYTSVIGGK